MREKVHCAHNQWDGLILSGVADFHGEPFYFLNLIDDGSVAIYEMTPLSEFIFDLEKENWTYWLDWYHSTRQDPHPMHYANLRKEEPVDSVKERKLFSNPHDLARAEAYYQNQLIIDRFLKDEAPTHYAEAVFYGDRDGIEDTEVYWTAVDRPVSGS